MNTLLKVERVIKKYGTNVIINNISFEIEKGDFLIIKGESGSGKSTLLNLIAGFERIDGGNIIINGVNINELSESKKAKFRLNNIGFVFQQYRLLSELNVKENIMLPLLIKNDTWDISEKKAKKLLKYIGLENKWNYLPEQLSGGQNQRIAIARSLITEPKIILADEPTGNLDSKNSKSILELFKQLNFEKKCTIIMVTHSERQKIFANKLLNMEDGKII